MDGGGRATLTLHHFVNTTDIAKHHLGVDNAVLNLTGLSTVTTALLGCLLCSLSVYLFVVGFWWWGSDGGKRSKEKSSDGDDDD